MTPEEFAVQEKLILSDVPEELHSALSYMAYEQGHAYGYTEVLIHLQTYVDNLAEPIDKLIARVRQETR